MSQSATGVRELVPLLRVADIRASVAFYRAKLGFRVAEKWEPDGKLAWCRLELDGSALMLQQSAEEDGPSSSRGRGVEFYFICDDASALHQRFSAAGLKLDPPAVAFYGMNQLFVQAPDGYRLCFENPTLRT